MEYTFRWFGPQDPSKLKEIRQIGINGIVTSLTNVKYGQKWGYESIKKRKSLIESFKVSSSKTLNWSVVESLPVHNDIKKRSGNYKYFIDQYKDSLINLAKNKVTNICYNFMPLIDWVRTDLNFELPNEPESYVHRIGRTARAGLDGTAYSFCAAEERGYLNSIEKLIKQKIEVMEHKYHSETAKNAVGAAAKPAPKSRGSYRGGKKRFGKRRRR